MTETGILSSDQQDNLTTDTPSFAMVPEWVLDRASGNAVKLYGIIKSYADNKSSRAFPGRKTLAQRMGYTSVRSIDNLIKELRDLGALVVTPRWRDNGGQTSNLYMIRFNHPPKGGAQNNEHPPVQNTEHPGEQNSAPQELDPISNSYPNEVEGVAVGNESNSRGESPSNETPPPPSRPEGFRNGKWMPSDQALQTAREVNEFVDIPILISKYAVWCQKNKRDPSSSGWLQWFFKDEQEMRDEERRRRQQERTQPDWINTAD